MLKDYHFFFRDPGTVDEIRCRVCGTKCNVKRNEYGPTCYAAAVGGLARHHDLFTCPHSEKRWHELALDLVEAIDETPSRTLARLMKLDLKRILRRKIKPQRGSLIILLTSQSTGETRQQTKREKEKPMDDGRWPEDTSYWPPTRACWFTRPVEEYWKTYGEYRKFLRDRKVISLEEYRRKKKEREEQRK